MEINHYWGKAREVGALKPARPHAQVLLPQHQKRKLRRSKGKKKVKSMLLPI